MLCNKIFPTNWILPQYLSDCIHKDLVISPCDAHQEKTDRKVFVVVIPQEGWTHMATPILLLIWHRLFRIWLFWLHRSHSLKVGVIPKEGWAWPRLKVCFLVTHLKFAFYLHLLRLHSIRFKLYCGMPTEWGLQQFHPWGSTAIIPTVTYTWGLITH